MKFKFQFIDNAKFFAKRLWSVRAAAFASIWAGVGAWWLISPQDWKPFLPEPVKWVLGIIGVLVAASPGFVATLHQPKLAAQVQVRKEEGTMASAAPVPPSALPSTPS